jgi:hypothetical protein
MVIDDTATILAFLMPQHDHMIAFAAFCQGYTPIQTDIHGHVKSTTALSLSRKSGAANNSAGFISAFG